MKCALLFFPDAIRLADFVVNSAISNAEVNSRELSLTATMSDDDIITAVSEYNAFYKTEVKAIYFPD